MVTIKGVEVETKSSKSYQIRAYNPRLHIIQTRDYDLYQKVMNELEGVNTIEEVKEIKRKYKKPHKNAEKYIYKFGKSYYVMKFKKYFGSYETLEDAKEARDKFEKNGWDSTTINYSRKRWKWDRTRPKITKHIYPTHSNKYAISKNNEYYGTFNTLEEAIEERDLLEKYHWDYCEMIESEGVDNVYK